MELYPATSLNRCIVHINEYQQYFLFLFLLSVKYIVRFWVNIVHPYNKVKKKKKSTSTSSPSGNRVFKLLFSLNLYDNLTNFFQIHLFWLEKVTTPIVNTNKRKLCSKKQGRSWIGLIIIKENRKFEYTFAEKRIW
jgi:hypothetical protein